MIISLNTLLNIKFPLTDPVPIFTIVLFIILLAPLLLRKLRIPSIIGLIIAGMAIGDYGFNIVAKGSIDLFSQAGLLYIMFLAGLELDMAEFKKNTYKSLVFGFLTFALPLAMGYWVCMEILQFDQMASLLISSMFATHTLVAYPLASRMGIAKNEAVTITVGGTIITDTAVLLILAVIAGSAQGNLDQAFWSRLIISFVVFALIVGVGFPLLGRWFFKKIKDDQTIHFIFVLALVFLAAFLAELAGVESIIGAFLAGLALNQLIPHSSALMNRIEFAGNAIFIPFFLISVGMIVDLRILLKGPQALIIAGILTTVALSSKWLAAWVTQMIFRYNKHQRQLIFGLSSAHAAATIAVVLIGYNMKIIDENVLNGTIILILITCMVGSFVTANAAKRLALLEANREPEVINLHQRILIPVTDKKHMEPLIDLAVLLDEKKETDPIYLLNVVQDQEGVKERVLLENKNMEAALKHAAETETNVNLLTRVDLNPVNGITKAVKEMLISDVIVDWNDKSTATPDFFLSKLFGTTTNNLLDSTWETVYLSKLIGPLNTTTRIVLLVTPDAQYEIGFGHWVMKVGKLSKQLNARILLFSTSDTSLAVEGELKKNRQKADIAHFSYSPQDDISNITRKVKPDDLIITVGARKGTISYNGNFENTVARLSKQFQENNFIAIYAEQDQGEVSEVGMQSQDITLTPIQDQIDNLNKIGKAVKKIFRRDDSGNETEKQD